MRLLLTLKSRNCCVLAYYRNFLHDVIMEADSDEKCNIIYSRGNYTFAVH